MFYRESGQLKSSYAADQAMFPVTQDRWFVIGVLAVAFLVIPLFILTSTGPTRSCCRSWSMRLQPWV